MGRLSNCVSSVNDRFCYGLARPPLKEACAEFLGTFVLVVLGSGVSATCVLGGLNSNAVLTGALGWGLAVMVAVAIAGGVSGGHVNPAVTVALASAQKCDWKRVIPFLVAQYMASFLAAAVVYLTYIDAIHQFDGGVRQLPPSVNATAHIFATYPQDFASLRTCMIDQVIGTALLLMVICAAIDMRNLRVPPHTQPMIIGLGVAAILAAFGHNCGGALNPARDFAPRLLTAISGWGIEVFSYRNYEWFWIPIVAPHIGGIAGVWLYKTLIELPFKNYTRFLEEMESAEESGEDARRQIIESASKPRILLDRSISSEDGTYKRITERAESQNMKTVPEEVTGLSQRKSTADPIDLV